MGWGAGPGGELLSTLPALEGPSAMWIFRWAFRFPTCTQTGGSEGQPPSLEPLVLYVPGALRGSPFLRSGGEGNALWICPPSFFPSLPCALQHT